MTLRPLAFLLLLLAACLPSGVRAQAEGGAFHARPSLSAEYAEIDGKSAFRVLLRLDVEDGWHTYWKNPGDSGLETRIKWAMPKGYAASDILWQPPHRLPLGPMVNYGYSGRADHLVVVTPAPLPPGTDAIILTAEASWLVCKETCIPERAALSLPLKIGAANVPSGERAEIDALAQKANLPALPLLGAESDKNALTLRVDLRGANLPKIDDAYFFPEDGEVIDHAAPQRKDVQDGVLALSLPRGIGETPAGLQGTLEISAGGKTRYFSVGAASEAPTPPPSPPAPRAAEASPSLPLLLAFAFLGGVVLNAMPCVFPILSLKALAIAKKSDKQRGAVRLQGIAYCLGCLVSFAAIGGLLMALRAAGEGVGWGYQMQSPLFVATLAMLMFAVGLNLIGFLPVRFQIGGGSRAAGKEGFFGSFATGGLAVLVATPCTAPFMATALGAALTQPVPVAMLTFLSLGFGLSFPYLLLAFSPAALKRLPKPGAWMVRFKEFLAFPMFLTAVWLLWILAHQAGPDGAALVAAGAVALCLTVWIARHFSLRPLAAKLCLAASALLFAYPFAALRLEPEQDAAHVRTLPSSPYAEETLQALLAEGKPVFVYATASWCITCKVNERVALESAEVRQEFAKTGVAVLKADWTNADPHIAAFLERFNRNGVPLYVYYPEKNGEPRVLPQLLTPKTVIDYLHP
jgi:thiol:disulfide interchange protein/DsbC/DsbD-like thiol-disulfide interchange protein